MNTIAMINIAKSQLRLDEDAYRGLLSRVTGIASLRAMSERQRIAVVDELKRLGFQVKAGKGTAARLEKVRPNANRPHCRYIHALWRSCVELGVIEDASIRAKNAFCKKFVAPNDDKIAVDIDFLSKEQADPIISALKAMEKRGKEASRA